jgi:hypothetical protein
MQILAICVLSFLCVTFGLIIWYLQNELDECEAILDCTLRDLDECQTDLKDNNTYLNEITVFFGGHE